MSKKTKTAIAIETEIKGVAVASHDKRECEDHNGDGEENTWDYYTLSDGRRCLLRNGFFWAWL